MGRGRGAGEPLLGLGTANGTRKSLVVLQVCSQTSSISITWAFVENSNSRAPLLTYQAETLGVGTSNLFY